MEHTVEETGPAIAVKTFVIFDIETTGLPSPGYNPSIMELCLIAVTREELLTKQKAARVLNKLAICLNPCKNIGLTASQITGLHNDALEDMASFSKQAPLIITFLKNLPQPVCLIAHNGNLFDFPLLVSHLRCDGGEIPENILCADSLEALRTFDGLPPVPEFILERIKAKNLSAIPLAANTPAVKLVEEISETKGNMLVSRTQSIGSRVEANEKTQQSCNESSENLKRTADPLEMSDVNSKHGKVSFNHEVVWGKFEHTPQHVKPTNLLVPELVNNSEENLPNSSQVKRYLFKEDFSSGMESKSSDLHPIVGGNMTPTCNEDVNLTQNQFLNKGVLCNEGKSLRTTNCKNGIAKSGPAAEINSNSQNCDVSSLAKSPNYVERLESKVKFVGEKVASSPVVTQNYSSLENNSSGPITSPSLVGKGVKKYRNIQKAEKLSYSLINVYTRIFGQKPAALHSAEGDCLALLEILRSKTVEFYSWCERNAVPLASISPMY